MPINVLLVDDDESLRSLYTIFLDNLTDDIVVTQSISGNSAIDILKNSKKFDIVLSDYNMPDGTGMELYLYIAENHESLPFVLISAKPPEEIEGFYDFIHNRKNNQYKNKPIHKKDMKHIFNTLQSRVEFEEQREFSKIRSIFFLRFNKILCDIYLKISNNRFVKIMPKGNIYDASDIKKYIDKGVDFFYVYDKDFEVVEREVLNGSFLTHTKRLDDYHPLYSWRENLEVLTMLMQSFGISKSVMDISMQSMDSAIKIILNDKNLNSLIFSKANSGHYFYDHSFLVSLIANSIIDKLDWGSSEHCTKLTLAAIFHDMTLSCGHEAMIQTQEEDAFRSLKFSDRQKIKNHPEDAAEFIRKMDKVPDDVIKVVEQHHERFDGSGFPRGLTAERMHNLTCVFIVAHDFVLELYQFHFDHEAKGAILDKVVSRYGSQKNIKPISDALRISLSIN